VIFQVDLLDSILLEGITIWNWKMKEPMQNNELSKEYVLGAMEIKVSYATTKEDLKSNEKVSSYTEIQKHR
jgi:hypothetical protein